MLQKVRAVGKQPDEIIEGDLECVTCATLYPIRKGIPNLLSQKLLEEYKKQEMQGWVSLWNKKGMYERPTLEHSFQLPYLGDGPWIEVARMFDLARRDMDLKGNEIILDMGAGQGWASRYFAAKGCRVVAVDIVDDEWYGLGRARAIMDKAGVYFEPLLADGEKLPFFPETFDIVFFCGALHHFRDFSKVLGQAHRVLKPWGRLIATGEPAISILTRERAVQDQLEETHEGIVERRAKVWEYWWRFRQAGFRRIQMNTFETYGGSSLQIRSRIVTTRHNLFQSVRRPYRWLAWLVLSSVLIFPSRRAQRLALLANGGNLFIKAVKPSRE